MRNWLGLDRLALWLARKSLALLVQARVLPEPLLLDVPAGATVCYVLESKALSGLLVLDQVCIEHALPRPAAPMPRLGEPRAIVMLRGSASSPRRRRTPPRLARLVRAAYGDPQLDVRLVPVSIFWGRSPDKQHSYFKLLFSESWAVTGPLFRLLAILLHGRDTLVQFSAPGAARLREAGLEPASGTRRLHRFLRVHFRKVRVAAIGPDLHTGARWSYVVRSSAVRRVVREEAKARGLRGARHSSSPIATPTRSRPTTPSRRARPGARAWWRNQRCWHRGAPPEAETGSRERGRSRTLPSQPH